MATSLALLLALPVTGLLAPASPGSGSNQPTDLSAVHRSGQTFLTWTERADLTGEHYRVYRHDAPIDAGNLDDATLLLEVPEGTARFFANRHRIFGGGTWQDRYLENYVVEDDGAELPVGTGLLVWTLWTGEEVPGGAYYAVTTVDEYGEDRNDLGYQNTTGPIGEAVADPAPVRTAVDVGPGGTLYVQYMDVRSWNPTFHAPRAENLWYGLNAGLSSVSEGLAYAYSYVVYAPASAVCAQGVEPRSPVLLFLHGWNDNTYPAYLADPFPDYCGYKILPTDVSETWWFGFAKDHDYRTGAPIPASDRVVNYTEARVLRMVKDLLADPLHAPAIDPDRVYVFGHSMGGSGALAMALRYPQVFAAAHANDPMTRYATVGDGGGQDWRPLIELRWGTRADALPVELVGPAGWADPLAVHDGTSVWDWQDHQANVLNRRSDDIVPLGITHGSLDTTIEWTTQGRPAYALFDQSDRCWGGQVLNEGHSWKDFAGLPPTLAADAEVVPFAGMSIVLSETVPGLSACTADSPLPPAGTARFNHVLDWSASWNPWDELPVDLADRWEISLRTTVASTHFADVTPRRTALFEPTPGSLLTWENFDVPTDGLVATGTVAADADGLVTVPSFEIGPSGNRLVLRPFVAPPAVLASFGANPTSGSAPLEVSFTDLSTGPVASWAWDFGDGGTSTERHPTHVFVDAGTYDVSLTVSGGGTSDTHLEPALIQVADLGTISNFGCGLNPPGSLVHLSGSPNLGQEFTLGVDNPLGTQTVGSRPTLYLSYAPDIRYPCGVPLLGWSMYGPGTFGEVLIGRGGGNPFFRKNGALWTGPGNPVPITVRTPTSPSFIGMSIYGQAVMFDLTGSGVRSALTEGVILRVGP